MTHTDELRNFVAGWETLALKAYAATEHERQRGIWTIGYGHTTGVRAGDTCTPEQADEWLDEDLIECADELLPYIERDPAQNEFDALLSLAFNCGPHAIGRSGLLARYNDGQDAEVVKRWVMWNKQAGRVLRGLVNRRQAELRIFLHGDYSGRP
jgi:lysozyme